jgi:assimilatory nitrate reductase catalytic subunit
VLLRLAATEAPAPAAVAEIEALFGLGSGQPQVLRYEDRRRGQRRAIGLHSTGADAQLRAFVLAGDTRAEGWIKALLLQRLPAQAFGSQLLSPNAQAPQALAPAGRQVCTCFNVGEPAIVDTLAGCDGNLMQRLTTLQDRLKCGTNCGSCLPELRRLAQAGMVASPPAATV